MMKFYFFAIVVLICVGCSPRVIIQRDTLTSTATVTKEVLRDTTIYVVIPADSVAISTLDTVSNLRTKIAHSTASITNGILTHTLGNNAEYRPEIKVYYKDRYITRDSVVVLKNEVPVYEEKPETKWNKFIKIMGYMALASLLVIGLMKMRNLIKL